MNLELSIYGKIKMDAHSLDAIDRVLRMGGRVSIFEENAPYWHESEMGISVSKDGYVLYQGCDNPELVFGWNGEPFDNLIAFLQREGWTE